MHYSPWEHSLTKYPNTETKAQNLRVYQIAWLHCATVSPNQSEAAHLAFKHQMKLIWPHFLLMHSIPHRKSHSLVSPDTKTF